MKKCCIAGKMRGCPGFNFDAFDDAKADVRALGYHPISPADMDRLYEGWGTYPPEDWQPSREDFVRMMSRDLKAIEDCDAVYLLRGWEQSRGTRVEAAYAEFLGLEVIVEPEKQMELF